LSAAPVEVGALMVDSVEVAVPVVFVVAAVSEPELEWVLEAAEAVADEDEPVVVAVDRVVPAAVAAAELAEDSEAEDADAEEAAAEGVDATEVAEAVPIWEEVAPPDKEIWAE